MTSALLDLFAGHPHVLIVLAALAFALVRYPRRLRAALADRGVSRSNRRAITRVTWFLGLVLAVLVVAYAVPVTIMIIGRS